MKYIVDNFESIEHLLRALRNRQPNSVWRGKSRDEFHSERTDGDRLEFTGTRTYQEAEELIREGYTDPLEKIKRGVEANINGATKRRSTILNDVIGFAPCVPNAILGLPKSMINMNVDTKKSKIISIISDVGSNCMTQKETFINSGIAVLSLIYSLEAQGYRVSLKVAFDNAVCGNERTFATVNLKDWRQPIDLKKMTFPFCHPSMLRRIGFKWLETQPDVTEQSFLGGYGSSVSSRDHYEKIIKELKTNKLLSDNDFYINIRMCEDNFFNPQKIAKACGLNV